PAYFGDHGHVGTVQPNYGLDALFGCRQSEVEFAPDLSENLQFQVLGRQVYGRYFRQEYAVTDGTAIGQFAKGAVAAVEQRHGKGRAVLMGSFPAAGYYLHHGAETKALFASLLERAAIAQRVRSDNPQVQVRLHEGANIRHLWATNATARDQ